MSITEQQNLYKSVPQPKEVVARGRLIKPVLEAMKRIQKTDYASTMKIKWSPNKIRFISDGGYMRGIAEISRSSVWELNVACQKEVDVNYKDLWSTVGKSKIKDEIRIKSINGKTSVSINGTTECRLDTPAYQLEQSSSEKSLEIETRLDAHKFKKIIQTTNKLDGKIINISTDETGVKIIGGKQDSGKIVNATIETGDLPSASYTYDVEKIREIAMSIPRPSRKDIRFGFSEDGVLVIKCMGKDHQENGESKMEFHLLPKKDTPPEYPDTEKVYTTTGESNELGGIVGAMNKISDEVKLNFSEDGIKSCFVDPAKVAMERLDIKKPNEAQKSKEGVVGARLPELDQAFSKTTKREEIKFSVVEYSGFFDEDEGDTPEIKLGFEIETENFKVFLRGLDPENIRDEPDIPDLDLPSETTVDVDVFTQAISDCTQESSYIALEIEENEFSIKTMDDEIHKKVVLGSPEKIEKEDSEKEENEDEGSTEEEPEPDEKIVSLYSSKYMRYVKEALSDLSPSEVTVYLGTDYPTRIATSLSETEAEFLLAPRIENT